MKENTHLITGNKTMVHFATIASHGSVSLKGQTIPPDLIYCSSVYYDAEERGFIMQYVISGDKDNPKQEPVFNTISLNEKEVDLLIEEVFAFLGLMFNEHEKNIYLEVQSCADMTLFERLKLWIQQQKQT